jgi:hypothetical protein
VTVPADKPVTITAGELDRLYQDNELLLSALLECQGKK